MYRGSMTANENIKGLEWGLWAYIISNVQRDGWIELYPQYLSSIFHEPVEEIETALSVLTADDPYSRTVDEVYGGRRLIRDDHEDSQNPHWYFVVNYAKYQAVAKKEELRRSNALRQKKYRSNKKTRQ